MLKKVIEECLHMYYGSNNLMLAGIVKMRFEFFFFCVCTGERMWGIMYFEFFFFFISFLTNFPSTYEILFHYL